VPEASYVGLSMALFTDSFPSYIGLSPDYVHQVINHAERYVDGKIHTNGMENFWSLLKRMIKGTSVHCMPFHLFRYLDEESFRFNEQKAPNGDSGRFLQVVAGIVGKRVTYTKLTGRLEGS